MSKKPKKGKKGKSVRGYTSFQSFGTTFGWVNFLPLFARTDVPKAFKQQFKKYGVPDKIIMDPAKEQVLGEAKALCDELDCSIIGKERGIPCKRAEASIKRLKHKIIRGHYETNSPAVFWCYCGERERLML